MAPPMQPSPLYRLCLGAASSLVDQGCTNIFLEHGSYGNPDCLAAINDFQHYLVTTLPLTVFEHLTEDRNSRTKGNVHHNSLLLWSKDPRIKLGLFLHPSIRKFNVDGKGNELMLMQQQDDFGGSNIGGLDEFFWCAHLRRLVNLVYLSLNLITTDEILILIGTSCRKLEVVNIVSRIKQDNVSSYIQQEQQQPPQQQEGAQPQAAPQPPSMFPGITLKFCVSDVGLEALLQCKSLRRITMNKIINQTSASVCRGISHEGVRRLVRGLKNLEYISFGSLGKILHTGFEPLSDQRQLRLTHFSELDPSYVDVPLLTRMCPNIAHIALSVPIIINSSGAIDANVTPCAEIMNALAASDLPLKVIELHNFPFCEAFRRLLRAKGHRVSELMFRALSQLNSEHVIFIGETCPKLQKLHIKELGPEPRPVFCHTAGRAMFNDLIVLHLSGRLWNPNIILPLTLKSAKKVTKLSLLNMSQRLSMDQALSQVLRTNKLTNVASISLYSGCFLSISLVRKLTFDCPKLTVFSFIQADSFDLAEVERLRLEIAKKNLNMKLCCLEMFEV